MERGRNRIERVVSRFVIIVEKWLDGKDSNN